MSGDAGDYSRNWMDYVNEQIPIPYPLLAVIIGVLIYYIYDFFCKSIWFLTPQWTISQKTNAAFLCMMIALQFAGTYYITNNMLLIFSKIDNLWGHPEEKYLLRQKKRLDQSLWYYVLLASLIIPFYLIDIARAHDADILGYYYQNYLQCCFIEINLFNVAFDIFNNLVGFLVVFLLSETLWIMINLAWSLAEFSEKVYKSKLNKYIADVEVSLETIREMILHMLSFYFMIIFMFIINFNRSILLEVAKIFSGDGKTISINKLIITINPKLENVFIIILLLIGVAIFFVGINTLNGIFRSHLRMAQAAINVKSQEYTQALIGLQLSGDLTQNSGNLNYISSMLDVLQKQRERLSHVNSPGYSLKTIGTFVTAFLIPFVTFIDKVKPGITAYIMNQIYMMINSAF